MRLGRPAKVGIHLYDLPFETDETFCDEIEMPMQRNGRRDWVAEVSASVITCDGV